MKKIIIALLCGFTSIANAELISDNKNNKVEILELEVLLETAPVFAQKKLLKNKARLKKQLEQAYLKKILAEMAVAEGLDKDPMNAVRLNTIMNNALFLLKLDALKKENKKDYSKYAKVIYRANKADYPVKQRIDAAHILISTKELSETEALSKAQKIRNELMLGAVFSELALKESDDKSVMRNNGELGTFASDQMVKEFSDIAFAMQEGGLSEPVKTKYGYHIIKLNKKMSAGVKSFEEVQDIIVDKLTKEDWVLTRDEFFQQLKDKNEMEIDEQALDEFVIMKLDELADR